MTSPTKTLKPLDLTRCTNRTATGRQCKLNPGHDQGPNATDHRYIIRDGVAAPKTMDELSKSGALGEGFSLKMEAVPEGTDVSREQTRAELPRDAHQKKVDKDAVTAYNAWVKAGKQDDFEKSPLQRYVVPPAAFDTVIAMLRRATTSGGPLRGKTVSYRRKAHESGNVIINFRFADKKESNPVNADGESGAGA